MYGLSNGMKNLTSDDLLKSKVKVKPWKFEIEYLRNGMR